MDLGWTWWSHTEGELCLSKFNVFPTDLMSSCCVPGSGLSTEATTVKSTRHILCKTVVEYWEHQEDDWKPVRTKYLITKLRVSYHYISAIMTSEKQTLEDPSHDLLLYHLSSHLVRWPPVARCQALNRPMQSTPASGSLPKASPLSMLTCQALYLSLSMHLSMLLTTSISQPCWWYFRGAASSTCDHKT